MRLKQLLTLAGVLCLCATAWAEDLPEAGATYYLRTSVDDEYQYLAYGGCWGSQAITVEEAYAQPIYLISSESSGYEFFFPASNKFLFDASAGDLYCDNSTYPYFDIEAVTGGYAIQNLNTAATSTYGKYITVSSNVVSVSAASSDEAAVWEFLTEEEYLALVDEAFTTQSLDAAVSAGIIIEESTEVTTVEALEEVLGSSYTTTSITLSESYSTVGESYQPYATWSSSATTASSYISQTVSLEEGFYCFEAQAFQRIGYNDVNGEDAHAPLYLRAGDAKVLVMGLYDGDGASSVRVSNDAEYDSKYYANGTASATIAFTADEYTNKIYFYVSETANVTIDLYVPFRGNLSGTWVCYQDFSLVKYVSKGEYTLGTATCSIEDGSVVDEFSSFTVTWPDANGGSSNTAASVIGSSSATLTSSSNESVATATISSTENGITMDFGTLSLTEYETYTISIPEGVYGWSDESVTNEAISVSFTYITTPTGNYYLRTTDSDGEYLYLSNGSSWSTCAVADEYGLPVTLANTASGTTVYFYDKAKYLFDAGSATVYTDKTTYPYWAFEAVTSGYVIKNLNDNGYSGYYLTIDTDNANHIVTGTATSADDATVWTLEAIADHAENMQLVDDRYAAEAAEAANIDADSEEDLEALVIASEAITLSNSASSVDESYQPTATKTSSSPNDSIIWSETVTLETGLYKLSAQAFQRYTWNGTLDGARSFAFLKAGDAKTQIMSVLDGPGSSTNRGSGTYFEDYQYGDLYYPNGTAVASTAFDAEEYTNDVWFYVEADGTEVALSITFGVYLNGQSIGNWICYQDIALTKYSNEVEVEIGSTGYATLYYGDVNLTIPEGVSAYTAQVSETNSSYVELTEVSETIPAATGVVLKGDEGSYAFTISSDEGSEISDNALIGADEETTFNEDDYLYYILSTSDDDAVGFYWQDGTSGTSVKSAAHKAVLKVASTESSVKGLTIVFNDATGISSVGTDEATGTKGIYTLTGVKLSGDVQSLQPGLYIIDGQKTLVR